MIKMPVPEPLDTIGTAVRSTADAEALARLSDQYERLAQERERERAGAVAKREAEQTAALAQEWRDREVRQHLAVRDTLIAEGNMRLAMGSVVGVALTAVGIAAGGPFWGAIALAAAVLGCKVVR